VIDRVKSSTNEVGGRVLELSGTRYMIRGLGYLKSLSDLETYRSWQEWHPRFSSRIWELCHSVRYRGRRCRWQGDGETVGGIVVMRYGLNALTVTTGQEEAREIKPLSLRELKLWRGTIAPV